MDDIERLMKLTFILLECINKEINGNGGFENTKRMQLCMKACERIRKKLPTKK